MDHTGTIDPATLNAAASTISPNLLSQRNPPRGTKRSRSPDTHNLGHEEDLGHTQHSKRSRSLKSTELSSAASRSMPHPVQTPPVKTNSLSRTSPAHASPTQSSPTSVTKPAVVKALPTVRDHTTDQLNPEGDEYIPRETDPAGDTKVSPDGHALGGRKFRCRTFTVPNRGEKLFMLATECARVLGYRDSYLLFNKNRSLFKIIANQPEKDNLIQQDILPYSYRSRQIAIVTARSMFRQFGARLVENGHRVRDDYWEAKAIKQGFTEDDAASEKRPGAARAREAAAAEASQSLVTTLPQGQIIYTNDPDVNGQGPAMEPTSLAPLPMIHLPGDDLRTASYGSLARPRQEMTGATFQDRTQPSTIPEIMMQAGQAAEYNKQLSQARGHRSTYLDDYWRRPHEQPVVETSHEGPASTMAASTLQSPQAVAHLAGGRMSQDSMAHVGQQMMAQPYGAYPSQQNPMTSPVQPMHRGLPQTQMHQGSPTMNMGGAAGTHRPGPAAYSGYGANQMWQQQQQQQQQPQPSPMAQSHHMLPQYAQQHQQSQMLPPQMPQPGMGGGYPQMAQMGNPAAAYSAMNRNMYQASPNAQQYPMHQSPQQQQHHQQQQQQHQNMQAWSNPGTAGGLSQQDWQRFQ